MDRLTRLTAVMLLLAGLAGDLRADRFTVAGDVPAPQTREYPAGGPVSIQKLLRDAGTVSPGAAVVIRGESRQAFTEYVDFGAAGSESILMDGDVVVFRTAESPAAVPNVVVVGQGGAVIVNLSGAGSQLGFLLHHLKIPHPPGQEVPAIRTGQGSPVRVGLTPEAPLQHGDVLLLSDVFVAAQDFGSPVFTGAAGTMPTVGSVGHQDFVIQEPDAAAPGQEPELELPPIDVSVPGAGGPADHDTVDREERTLSEIPLTLAALELPVDDGKADADPANGQADFSESTAAAAPISAGGPAAGQNQPPGPPFWNAVFLFGLLGSVVLIVSGWLNVRREQGVGSAPAATSDPRIAAPAADVPVTTDSGKEGRTRTAEENGSTKIEATADPVQAEPVADGEWYGSDWRSGNSSAGRSSGTAASRRGSHPEPRDDVIPLSMIADASGGTQARSDIGSTAADDLDDLIRNRLPVVLQDAELPQHVSLYGRPAGPRRLRIDAAHTELTAPHFAAAAQRSAHHATVAVHRSSEPDRTGTDPGEPEQSDASLDRALNSLHGQNDR